MKNQQSTSSTESTDVPFYKVIANVFSNIKYKEVITIFILSALGTGYPLYQLNQSSLPDTGFMTMITNATNIVPTLLGISLAGYTILFCISEFVQNRLMIPANDRKIPFEVLHATFALGIIIQIISFLWGLYSPLIAQCTSLAFAYGVSQFLMLFSIFWIGNIIFNLYALRTFLSPHKSLHQDGEFRVPDQCGKKKLSN